MTKYHIRKDGTPGQCHADAGHCPLGGASQHYATIEEAQAAADRKNVDEFTSTDYEHSQISSANNHTKSKSDKIKNMVNKSKSRMLKKAKYKVKRQTRKLVHAPIKITTKVAKKVTRKVISSRLGYNQMYDLMGHFDPNNM